MTMTQGTKLTNTPYAQDPAHLYINVITPFYTNVSEARATAGIDTAQQNPQDPRILHLRLRRSLSSC